MTLIASAFSGSLSVFMFMYIWQVSLILSRCSLTYLLTLWALAGNKITCHLHRVGRKFNPVTRTHTAYCCLDAAAVQVRIPVSLFCISVVYLTTVVVKDSIIYPVGAVSHLASDKPSDSDSDSIIFNCLIKGSLHKHLHLFLVFSLNHPLISEYLPLSLSEFPQHLNMAALWNVTRLQITWASSLIIIHWSSMFSVCCQSNLSILFILLHSQTQCERQTSGCSEANCLDWSETRLKMSCLFEGGVRAVSFISKYHPVGKWRKAHGESKLQRVHPPGSRRVFIKL